MRIPQRLLIAFVATALLAGVIVAALPTEAFAAPPGKCPCPKTITLPDGRVCKLLSCGLDCVYVSPY